MDAKYFLFQICIFKIEVGSRKEWTQNLTKIKIKLVVVNLTDMLIICLTYMYSPCFLEKLL